jgi:hypothetical protein
MTKKTEATEPARDRLPDGMHDPVVAYLVEQADKFRVLQDSVAEAKSEPGGAAQKTFEDFLSEGRPRCADMLEMKLKKERQASPSDDRST